MEQDRTGTPPAGKSGKYHPPLSLHDLKQGRYHTLSDARLLLIPAADRRSLNTWIEELSITTYKSPVRGHSFLISHKDLTTIASLVGRSLKDGAHPSVRKSFQISDLEAEQAREIAALQEQIELLQQRHAREISLLRAEHRREMNSVKQRVQRREEQADLSENLPSAARTVSSERSSERPASSYVPPELVKPHALPSGLPDGTIFLRWFTERHGATRDIMTAAAKRGDIRAIARPYGKEGTQYFLDPSMQDEAVAWMVRRGYGHTCEHCPHVKT